MADFSEFMERFMAERARLGPESDGLIAAALPLLHGLGVTVVTIEYDGMGDSGEMYPPYAVNEADEKVTLPKEIVDALDGYGYRVLEAHWPGWEINEGSTGKVVIDLGENRAWIEHGQRVESVEYHATELGDLPGPDETETPDETPDEVSEAQTDDVRREAADELDRLAATLESVSDADGAGRLRKLAQGLRESQPPVPPGGSQLRPAWTARPESPVTAEDFGGSGGESDVPF